MRLGILPGENFAPLNAGELIDPDTGKPCSPDALYPAGHVCDAYTKQRDITQILTIGMPSDPVPHTNTEYDLGVDPNRSMCGQPLIAGISNCYLGLGVAAVVLLFVMSQRR